VVLPRRAVRRAPCAGAVCRVPVARRRTRTRQRPPPGQNGVKNWNSPLARCLPWSVPSLEPGFRMKTLPVNPSAVPVLYVEDHPVNAMLMAALFEYRPGLRLVVATSVADALEQAPRLEPALLLLDIHLPDGNGCDLLPRLRRIPSCAVAPAVAVTAEDDFDHEACGFTELWTKPLDLSKVLRRLDALTGPDLGPFRMALHAIKSTPGAWAVSA